MKLETRKKISITVADIYTGELLRNNCLELDLRFKNNRDILFAALFEFIEKCRKDEYVSLEFQHTRTPIEQTLPF